MSNPVAWIHRFIEGGISIGKKPVDLDKHPDRWMPFYANPTPCQTCEALARTVMTDNIYHEKVCPKREWQGLTDEKNSEIYNRNYNLYEHDMHIGDFFLIQQAVETKLKEKNNG